MMDKKDKEELINAFENRSEADYGLLHEYTNQEVQKMFNDMKDFINEIDSYLKKN